MKKRLNTSILQNELQSGSAFFHHSTPSEKARKSTKLTGRAKRLKQSAKKGVSGNRPKQSPKLIDQTNRSAQSIETIDQDKQRRPTTKTVDQTNRPKRSTTTTTQDSRPKQSTEVRDQRNRPGQLVGPVKKGSPPAFYLPEIISDKIDEAVQYYREQCHIRQVDRTAIVAAILGDPAIWTAEALDKLANKVIAQFNDRKRRMLEERLR